VLAVAREILDEEPLIQRQLGERLAERLPHLPGPTMAYAVRALLPLVQIPPRGVWGRTGQPVLAPADTYLAGAEAQEVTLEDLIRRYLAAYGPASVADIQAWSGLTRLRDVVEDMRPGLLTYQAESGPELFDVPGAPHPDPDTPAPVRFLAEFDNATLSHAERTRVIRDDLRRRIATKNGMVPGMVLVDGFMAATYSIARKKEAATVRIIEYRRLSHPERQAIEAEAQTTARMGHPAIAVTVDFLPGG
jgi:hypothetical protein